MPLVSMGGGHKAFPKPRQPRPSFPSYAKQQRSAQNEENYLAQQAQQRIQSQARKAQKQYQSQIQNLINSYKPVQIPTFDPSYYMPQNTLKKINNLKKKGLNVNEKQIQNIAQQSVDLATNPELEALRKQISGLKALGPKERKKVLANYKQAQHQLANNTSSLIASAIDSAKKHGGLHPGVAAAISQLAQSHSGQLNDILNGNRNLDLTTLAGYLHVQKQNANNLLQSIQKNKKNMTKAQYNALHAKAVQQAQQAQKAQLQLLQSIAQMEQGARGTAAQLLQNKAAAKNQINQQIFGINQNLINQENQNRQASLKNLNSLLQNQLKDYHTQLQSQLGSQYQNAIGQWMNYLTGPDVRGAGDAMNRLRSNQANIINALGPQGYSALESQLKKYGTGWANPNAQLPWNVTNGVPNPRSTRTSQPAPQGFWGNVGNGAENLINGLFNTQIAPEQAAYNLYKNLFG